MRDGRIDDLILRGVLGELGDEFCIIYLNESTQMSYNTYQMACTRLAQVVKHGTNGRIFKNKMIVDANPRGPRHWVRKVCIEHKDPKTGETLKNADKWGVIADWSPYDNIDNLAQEYIDELVARRRSITVSDISHVNYLLRKKEGIEGEGKEERK